ncbi:Ger(x)C family spore germination C-terminal domain-containing protein [Bacillus cereus]
MTLFFLVKGTIQENNTNLDLSQPKNLTLLEHVLEKQSEKEALQTIKRFKNNTEPISLDLEKPFIKNIHPNGKGLKKNWSKQFRKVEVSVHTKLTIRRVGLTGPPLQLKKNEMKK